jgi:hypothetical protein
MYRVERAVSKWHRVYTELRAAQKSLGAADPVEAGDSMSAGQDLVAQVSRLQDEEEQALRAIHEALVAANARAIDRPAGPAGDARA